MQQLDGNQFKELIALLRHPVTDSDLLTEILITNEREEEWGGYSKYLGIPAILTHVVTKADARFQVVELVKVIIKHFADPKTGEPTSLRLVDWLNANQATLEEKKQRAAPLLNPDLLADPSELVYLIDRDVQVDRFRVRVSRALDDNPRKPIAVVLFGPPDAGQANLVKRLTSQELGGLPKLPSKKSVKHLPIPPAVHQTGGRRILLREICAQLEAQGEDEASLSKRLPEISKEHELIAVEIYVPLGDLRQSNFACVDRLLAIWDAIVVPPDLQVVSFIWTTVEEPDPPSLLWSWFRKAQTIQYQEEFSRRFPSDDAEEKHNKAEERGRDEEKKTPGRVLVLPELAPIVKDDLTRWRMQPHVEKFCKAHGISPEDLFEGVKPPAHVGQFARDFHKFVRGEYKKQKSGEFVRTRKKRR